MKLRNKYGFFELVFYNRVTFCSQKSQLIGKQFLNQIYEGKNMINRNFWRFLTLTILAVTATFSPSNKAHAAELLTNGGFETNLTGWTSTTTNGGTSDAYGLGAGVSIFGSSPYIGTDVPYSHATFPQEGSRSCAFQLFVSAASAGSATSKIYQDITVPAGTTLTVSWKQRISQINSTFLPTRLVVQIKNTSDAILQTLNQDFLPINTSEVRLWETKSVNLGTTYAGQTIRIEFNARTFDANAPNYFVTKGTWEIDAVSANAFAPTAASVSVSGRVLDSTGKPISQSRVRILDINGRVQSTLTNLFGLYRFSVEAGQVYAIEVRVKGQNFINSPRIIVVGDDIQDEDFQADSASLQKQE